jgi:hypothetical protein
MVRQSSDEYKDWREMILASPWVKEVTGDVQCCAQKGWVKKADRGDPRKADAYRCGKRAKFALKAASTRSMLIIDAMSGNYCPLHLVQAIEEHEGERTRFEAWAEKYRDMPRDNGKTKTRSARVAAIRNTVQK